MVRWSLTVSSETDRRLRAFLGQKGAKKGSLSEYVEEAVKQRLGFEETVNLVQERNLRYSEEEIEEAISEAIRETRAASRS
jgi:predicted CopG family antitoxin